MYPTRAQVKTRFQNTLDDPSGSVFSEAVFAPAFSEAYDALFTAFLNHQCPRIELVVSFTVLPGTLSLTPAQMGIADFGDFIYIAERPAGSQEEYRDLAPVDRLPRRAMTDRLGTFNYRNDTFYFVGSTNAIDIEIKYDSSGEAPADDTVQILVDGALTFLSNYSVGVSGGRKGYDEIAQRCLTAAVGPRYDQGVIGGELFRLIQPRVRSRQKVQIAPKPYSATRRLTVRPLPYVAAQQGTTGGGAQNVPIQFSTQDGTIVGIINGANRVFWIITGVSQVTLYLNGQMLTENFDYSRLNNQITILRPSPPLPGDILTAEAFILDAPFSPSITMPAQPNPPTQFTSASGGVLGTFDGVNTVFTLNIGSRVSVSFVIVFLNGVMQTAGVDYTQLNNVVTMTTAPNPGDILTIDAYTING